MAAIRRAVLTRPTPLSGSTVGFTGCVLWNNIPLCHLPLISMTADTGQGRA